MVETSLPTETSEAVYPPERPQSSPAGPSLPASILALTRARLGEPALEGVTSEGVPPPKGLESPPSPGHSAPLPPSGLPNLSSGPDPAPCFL